MRGRATDAFGVGTINLRCAVPRVSRRRCDVYRPHGCAFALHTDTSCEFFRVDLRIRPIDAATLISRINTRARGTNDLSAPRFAFARFCRANLVSSSRIFIALDVRQENRTRGDKYSAIFSAGMFA